MNEVSKKHNWKNSLAICLFSRIVQKQLAFLLGRQQIFLPQVEDEDISDIMSNANLNAHFLSLAREVGFYFSYFCLIFYVPTFVTLGKNTLKG